MTFSDDYDDNYDDDDDYDDDFGPWPGDSWLDEEDD
jgi:hypothetical protein